MATDKDSGKFGQILYFISGDGADLFVIEGILFEIPVVWIPILIF